MTVHHCHAHSLLDQALPRIDVPDEFGVVLEGSIAEGFGNDSSDVDFLVVSRADHDFPTMPTLLFIDGRRVEVRLRSERQMRDQAARLVALGEGGRGLAGMTDDLLNRCQRFSNSVTLRNPALVEDLRALIPRQVLEDVISRWFGHVATQNARYAIALHALSAHRTAALWSQRALIHAAKSWLTLRGESYLEPKWVGEQWARVDDADGLRERFQALVVADLDGDRRYVQLCAQLVADLGVTGCEPSAARLYFARQHGVTTWQIGSRVHVLRNREEVFVLDSEAAAAWRGLVFETPLTDVLERVALPAATAGRHLAEFCRLGLVKLKWRGGGAVTGFRHYSPPPTTARPLLSTEGLAGGEESIALGAISARRFAAMGVALTWHNMSVENSREDLAGALAQEQWDAAGAAALRILRNCCLVALCAYGCEPRPSNEEAPSQLGLTAGFPADLAAAAATLEEQLACLSVTAGAGVLDALGVFVRDVRTLVRSSFPESFVSATGWRETLEIGYDWVRLGGYLDAGFPADEVHDLIASGGHQPSIRSAAADDRTPVGAS